MQSGEGEVPHRRDMQSGEGARAAGPQGSADLGYPRFARAALHERENAKKPLAVRLSRPQFTRINGSADRPA